MDHGAFGGDEVHELEGGLTYVGRSISHRVGKPVSMGWVAGGANKQNKPTTKRGA